MARWKLDEPPAPVLYDDDQKVEADLDYPTPPAPVDLAGDVSDTEKRLYDDAVVELAKLFVAARVPVTIPSLASPAPHGTAQRRVEKPTVIKASKPDGWSNHRVLVGASEVTLAPRNPTRESLAVAPAGAILVAPGPGMNGALPIAAGDRWAIDTTAPVYATSADGTTVAVQVTQTFYGENV